MEDKISKRIQDLVQEIDSMVRSKTEFQRKLKYLDDEILRKSGAIHELKALLEQEAKQD